MTNGPGPDTSDSASVQAAPWSGDMRRRPGHLIRRAQQVHNAMWSTTVSREVTVTQFAVLSAVADHPWIDQNSICRIAALDTSTTGAVVSRLLERGLLRSGKDPQDRRRNLLALTDQGDELFACVAEAANAMTERMMAPLPPAERDELIRLLSAVVESGESGDRF